jgi:GxxExxY protein
MPVYLEHEIRRVSQEEFGELAFVAMGCMFEIHNEFGRFFDEGIYKRELQRRLPSIALEVPLQVNYEPFRKTYFLDVVFDAAAVFEIKTVGAFTNRHRAQLLNYLALCDLSHGKLVNLRPAVVRHEFINSNLRHAERTQPEFTVDGWCEFGKAGLRDWFAGLISDPGTGLDIGLYDDAVTDLFGGPVEVEQDVEIASHGTILGKQRFRLIQPDVAFKITALSTNRSEFEAHARRLLAQTHLHAIQWINVTLHEVTFQTLRRDA